MKEGEEASEQSKAENDGKFTKGRQYSKRKLRNKKSSISKTSDQLHLITLLEQVEEVLAPNSDPTDPDHVADDTSSTPAKRVFELILDTLQQKDAYEIFAEPVDPDEVEDYYEIIKDPMDFGTMRAKLHEDMYQSLHQFEHDVFLIFSNAMHFNSSTTIFFKQARALNDMAIKLFHALKTDPHKFELEFDTTKRRSATKIYSGEKRANGESKGLFTRDGGLESSLLNEDIQEDSFFTMMYPGSTPLVYITQQEIGYKENLMEFVKDLGPTARRVAQRKLQESEASKRNDFTINTANNNKMTQNASCGTTTRRGRGRGRRRSQFNIKEIVLGVPAAATAIRRNSIGKSMEIVKKNPPKKMKIESNVKSMAKDKCNHSDDHTKRKQEKGAMKAPSRQLSSSFALNKEPPSLIGSTTATQLFIIPRHHSNGMAATNAINNGVGCSYQVGSSANSTGREMYFKTTYLRSNSKHNGTDTCLSSTCPCLPNSKFGI